MGRRMQIYSTVLVIHRALPTFRCYGVGFGAHAVHASSMSQYDVRRQADIEHQNVTKMELRRTTYLIR